jgi:PAS domain S-box-containing protein
MIDNSDKQESPHTSPSGANESSADGERNRQIFETIQDMYCETSLDGTILEVSPGISTVSHYLPEEVVGRSLYDFYRSRDEREAFLTALTTHGKLTDYELNLKDKDGSFVPCSISARLLFDSDGKPVKIAGILRNIAARKAMETALRESEERHRIITSLTMDYVFRLKVGADGRVTMDMITENYKAMTGREMNDVVTPDLWPKIIHPNDIGRLMEFLRQLVSEGGIGIFEGRSFLKDGSVRWIQVASQAVMAGDPPRTVEIIGAVKDITERKRMEESLRESEEKYRSLFMAETDAIIVFDAETLQVLDGNDAAAKLYGYAREERFSIKALMVSGEIEKSAATINEVRQTGSAKVLERLHKKRDGTIFPVELSLSMTSIGGRQVICAIVRDITDRKKADEQLRRSEEKYRTLAEASPEMIYLVDREGYVRYLNSTAASKFGKDPAKIAGQHLEKLFPGQAAARHIKAIQHVMETGRTLTTEVLEPFESGPCWIDARLSPVRDDRGEVTGVLGLSTDISKRKAAEEELRYSEDRFRKVFEQGPVPMAMTDRQFRFIRANAAFCTLFGYTEGELQKMTFRDISLPEHLHADLEGVAKLVRGEQPLYSTEKQYLAKDGRTIWGALTLSMVRESGGRPLHSLAIISDITERKNLEDQIQNHIEFTRAIISGAGEGIIVYDRELRYLEWNAFMENLTGLQREVVLGRNAADFFPHIKEQNIDQLFSRALAGETVVSRDMHFRVPRTGKSGWTVGTYTPHKDSAGQIIGVIGLIRDITERKRMEGEMQRIEKLESLGVFAGGIAHDFNNLLSGVFGYMDLARSMIDPSSPVKQYLNSAFAAFDRAKNLSRQLLTFSKGGALVKRQVMLPNLIDECCSLALSGSNIKCEQRIDERLPPIEADGDQLAQVFSNILLNARQAMPEGGIITITAELRSIDASAGQRLQPGDYVTIAFRDRGIGIPANIIEKIFDPFFTTKQEGSGLGLATSYSIVNKHGGRIEVSSEPGAGSVFTIWLPATSTGAVELAAVAEEDLMGSGRILVMDDERVIAEMASAMLVSAGYDVSLASNGAEAIEKFEAARRSGTPFDAVVLDLTIRGGMGGEKVLLELQKIDPKIVAVVSSGYSESQVLANPAAYGFNGVTAKPYRRQDLLASVKKVLSGRTGK